MISFYVSGHNYEYEVRNALRVFDSNIDYELKDVRSFSGKGLSLISYIEEKDIVSARAYLYKDHELLYESSFTSNDIRVERHSSIKVKKTLVIKTIHNVLKAYYKVQPDYGLLTGVRVVKILLTAKRNLKSNEEINYILRNTYEVKEEKIKLLWDILKIEEKYINENNIKNYNLYISIPFCPSKCSYCSFSSYVNYNDKKIDSYLERLIYEIEETIEIAQKSNLNLHTIYVGGGTPSLLNEEQINKIFNSIKKYYDLSKIKEITFEAGRPDTISEEKLICLKENFVNRISINPQTMNDETLKFIGRKHSSAEIIEKYKLARKIGFEIINMDIILGLPGENEKDVRKTIEAIGELKPENITVHSLAYKRRSQLLKDSDEMVKDYKLINKMHDEVREVCHRYNYQPYYMYRQKNIKGNSENIGYTQANKESIYNMIIIEELETILACGVGASSKIMIEPGKHVPIRNFKGVEDYILRVEEIINKKKNLLGDKNEKGNSFLS